MMAKNCMLLLILFKGVYWNKHRSILPLRLSRWEQLYVQQKTSLKYCRNSFSPSQNDPLMQILRLYLSFHLMCWPDLPEEATFLLKQWLKVVLYVKHKTVYFFLNTVYQQLLYYLKLPLILGKSIEASSWMPIPFRIIRRDPSLNAPEHVTSWPCP